MPHNGKVSFILERNTEIGQESISRLTHNHSAEELATKPRSTTRRDRSLDNGNLKIRTSLAEHVCSAEPTGTSPNNDNIGLGIRVKVFEVTTGHGPANLGLTDGSKLEALLPLLANSSRVLGLVPLVENDFTSNPAFNGTLSKVAVDSGNIAPGGGIL
jgi:hypothetical protein